MTRFGLGVKDAAWLSHRLILLSAITAPSLLAQTDREFYWVVCIDRDLPGKQRSALEGIIAPFGRKAFLLPTEQRQYKAGVRQVAQELDIAGPDGLILTGIIDDDDAWNTEVVDTVRERADRWMTWEGRAPVVGITFDYGVEWVMYDMADIDQLQYKGRQFERQAAIRPYRYAFLGTSVFLLSALSSGITALSAAHSHMKSFLEKNAYDVDIVTTAAPMWLCCRHKQTGSSIQKSKETRISMSVDDLAVRFGIDKELTNRYIAGADDHGYAVIKRISRYRARLEAELKEIRERKGRALADGEIAKLGRREAQLVEDLAKTSEGVVGDLADGKAMSSHRFS